MKEKEEYLHKIFRHYWSKARSGEMQNYFIHVSDGDSFSSFINDLLNVTIKKEMEEAGALLYQYKLNDAECQEPYFPFLHFAGSELRGLDGGEIEKAVADAGVYHFQRPVFSKYFSEGVAERPEEVMPFSGEIDFEKSKTLESLLSLLLRKAGKSPLVIVVENAHFIMESGLSFIRHVASKRIKKPLFFIFSFNKEHKFSSPEREDVWKDFIHSVENSHSIIDYNLPRQVVWKGGVNERVISEPGRVYPPDEMIRLSRNLFQFGAYEECKEVILRVYHLVKNENIPLPARDNLAMLQILGDVHNFLDEQDFALIYYNLLLNVVQEMNNTKEIYEVFRKISLTYLKSGNVDSAMKFAKQALKLEWKKGNEAQAAKSCMLYVFFNNMELVYENLPVFDRMIPQLRELGMENSLTIVFTNSSYLLALNRAGKMKRAMEECREGIELAKKYCNEYRLSTAYHSMGLLLQAEGDETGAFQYYRKSEKLRLKLGSKIEQIKISNGIGYFSFTVEDYRNAFLYFNKALKLLEGEHNYQEICITLYNLAMVFFFVQDYPNALLYLEDVLFIMNQLKLEQLPFHTKSQLYPVYGIIFVKQKELNRAIEYMNKVRELPPVKVKIHEFFYELLKGMVAAESMEFAEAEMHFEKASLLLDDEEYRYLRPYCFYETGLMYRQKGDGDAAVRAFKKGLEVCGAKQYPYYRMLLEKETAGEVESFKRLQLKPKFFNVQGVIRTAKQELNLNKLHKKIDEMNFLNSLQVILVQSYEKETLVYDTMYLINNTFLVDVSFLYLKEKEAWECRYISRMPEELDFDPMELTVLLAADGKDKLVQRADDDERFRAAVGSVKSLISLPLASNGKTFGCMVFASLKGENLFSYDDLSTLSIVSKQLSIAMERIELMAAQRSQLDYIHQANRELAKRNDQFEKELSMARRVQESMIEGSLKLTGLPELRIGANFLFMESVGGDIIDVVQLGKNMYGFFIGDVSGHGVAAALITAMVKVTFSSYAKFGVNTGEVLRQVNNEICRFIGDLDYYVAAYYAVIDVDSGTIQYSNAGHHSAALYRNGGREAVNLDANGFVIGFLNDMQYESVSLKLKEGDRVLFLTDGIIEARNPEGKFYEDVRQEEFVRNNSGLMPQQFADALMKDVENFCEGGTQKDDRAVLCVDFIERAAKPAKG